MAAALFRISPDGISVMALDVKCCDQGLVKSILLTTKALLKARLPRCVRVAREFFRRRKHLASIITDFIKLASRR